jgi:hypothetical protein
MRLAGSIVIALALASACGPSNPESDVTPAFEAPRPMAPPAEGAGIYDANNMTPAQISERLVGTFRYADDDQTTLTITSAGEWTETAEGSESPTARWRVFAGTDAPKDAAETFTPASRYLEVIGEAGSFYYELGVVAEDGFDMFYVGRGNRLSFVRVKVPA